MPYSFPFPALLHSDTLKSLPMSMSNVLHFAYTSSLLFLYTLPSSGMGEEGTSFSVSEMSDDASYCMIRRAWMVSLFVSFKGMYYIIRI